VKRAFKIKQHHKSHPISLVKQFATILSLEMLGSLACNHIASVDISMKQSLPLHTHTLTRGPAFSSSASSSSSKLNWPNDEDDDDEGTPPVLPAVVLFSTLLPPAAASSLALRLAAARSLRLLISSQKRP
jgi:hypothetical protein